MLQFIRFAPCVAARGGRVIVACPAELASLLRSVPGVTAVVTEGEPLPPFDMHLPLLSLPRVLGTTVKTIPAEIPYLRPDGEKASRWRERLRSHAGLKVGLVWAGNPRFSQPNCNRVDRRRSLPPGQFAALANSPGAVFISLQKGSSAGGLKLLDWTEELHDFSDTAALVECLDLVISVDTAVAHLAGALGKQVWLLNRYDTCWRWLLERNDSPWYPTMRIFRQPKPGDWTSVIARVTEELNAEVVSQNGP